MTPVWFIGALLPMIASQVLRLHQHDAAGWLFWDYTGRLSGLGVLAVIPAARKIAFRREARRLALWEIALWVVGILLVSVGLSGPERTINAAFPMTVLGFYPRPHGWLHLFDLTFGLALVAFSEEIVFRRCARDMLQSWLGDRSLLVLATSLMFGCYHWWTGLGSLINASVLGALFMVIYRRSGALWPAVLAHYLVDVYFFI
jgi:membrane protease YdiL (CAAX protease family)